MSNVLKDVFVEQAEQRETPRRELIEATVASYLATFENDDIEGRLQLFAQDASFEDPVGTPPMVGHEKLRDFYRQVGGLATKAVLLRLAVNGHEAAMIFEVTIFGPDGDNVVVTVIETMEVDAQGRFSRLRAYWDRNAIR